MPSVRECARQQQVSPWTVVAAYDQLLAQGLIEARRQRGFYVRDLMQKMPLAQTGIAQSAIKNIVNRAPGGATPFAGLPPGSRIHATALIRGMFHPPSGQAQPGAGVFPAAWLEDARFMLAAVRKVAASQALREASFSYGEPMGDAGLRQMLANRLTELSVAAHAGQVMTTLGATHALDIVSRTLLKAGDRAVNSVRGIWT